MGKKAIEKCVEVVIESLTKKGLGLGIHEERIVEVPFAMPGDRIEATIKRKRSGVYPARLNQIITPSTNRIAPNCIHFGTCGGCKWQMIPYSLQLQEKSERVQRLFKEFDSPILPIIGSEPHWNYRNKMEFTFSEDLKGNRYLGLIQQAGSGKVVDLSECHLPGLWFVDALDVVKKWWKESGLKAYHLRKDTGSLRTFTLREGKNTGQKMAILTVSGHPDYAVKKSLLEELVGALKNRIGSISVVLVIHQLAPGRPTQFYEVILEGPDQITETLEIHFQEIAHEFKFKISPGAFFQPNTRQAEIIYEKAIELAEISSSQTVYDLYSGTGTLGIIASKFANQVVSIELSRQAVLDARQNAIANGCTNLLALEGDVGEVLDQIIKNNDLALPDVVFVDPPRAGLDEKALQHVLRLKPKKIVYISCNPETQARDVTILTKNGYSLTILQPIDQCPHTIHIENIAVLNI